MKKSLVLILLLAACSTGPTPDNTDGDGSACGAFSNRPAGNRPEMPPEETVILERTDVQRFRGTEMVKLLQKMDSPDPDDWSFVRRHVHPAPPPPTIWGDDGKLKRRNFEWPPRDAENPNAEQKAWRSYLLWPEHIRVLLHQEEVREEGKLIQPAWDSAETRSRLAAYGRMYARLYEFQARRTTGTAQRESDYWREFAESMLSYGDDGRELLISNMIVALSNPDEDVVYRAKDILTQIGEPAIEPLCTALWTSHRQLIVTWEETVDPDDPTGMRRIRTEGTATVGNPNYNRYILDTLYEIGPRAVGHAMTELKISLDENGKSIGTAWRFRRYFIELIGRLGRMLTPVVKAEALRTLEDEISRVVVQEYTTLDDGEVVLDVIGTDSAEFVFHEYIIQALGDLGAAEGLRPIIKLWKLDESHDMAAVSAISKLTKRKVRTIEDAREVAKALKVDLKGE